MNVSPNLISDRDLESRYIDNAHNQDNRNISASQNASFNIDNQSAMNQSNGFVVNQTNAAKEETHDSRQCSNIVTATFGGEQKFFSHNHSEQKN